MIDMEIRTILKAEIDGTLSENRELLRKVMTDALKNDPYLRSQVRNSAASPDMSFSVALTIYVKGDGPFARECLAGLEGST